MGKLDEFLCAGIDKIEEQRTTEAPMQLTTCLTDEDAFENVFNRSNVDTKRTVTHQLIYH